MSTNSLGRPLPPKVNININTINKGNLTNSNTSSKSSGGSSKIIMIIIMVIVGLFLAYLIYKFIQNYNDTSQNEPWIVKGTKIASTPLTVKGDKIKRSVDGEYGIEFSYVTWIYVNKWGTNWQHVFHKGSVNGSPLQAPGVWLYPNYNKLSINMNTFSSVRETCDIGNIPIGKWVHLGLVVIGKNIDIYINGDIKKRCEFKGIPKQNYGDLYVTNYGGFDGFVSKFKYFNYAIPIWKIIQLFNLGPSKAPCTDTGSSPPYLAADYWQTTGFPDALGPPLQKKSWEFDTTGLCKRVNKYPDLKTTPPRYISEDQCKQAHPPGSLGS